MMKVCNTCRVQKPLDDFQPHVRGAQGRRGQCRVCRNIYDAEWRANNVEARRAAGRRYVAKHREKHRGASRQYKTSFAPEEFKAALAAQEGCCAICHCDLDGLVSKHVHADHDHYTGRPRGVLCRSCNLGLGFYNDSILLLEQAIEYLKKHQK